MSLVNDVHLDCEMVIHIWIGVSFGMILGERPENCQKKVCREYQCGSCRTEIMRNRKQYHQTIDRARVHVQIPISSTHCPSHKICPLATCSLSFFWWEQYLTHPLNLVPDFRCGKCIAFVFPHLMKQRWFSAPTSAGKGFHSTEYLHLESLYRILSSKCLFNS